MPGRLRSETERPVDDAALVVGVRDLDQGLPVLELDGAPGADVPADPGDPLERRPRERGCSRRGIPSGRRTGRSARRRRGSHRSGTARSRRSGRRGARTRRTCSSWCPGVRHAVCRMSYASAITVSCGRAVGEVGVADQLRDRHVREGRPEADRRWDRPRPRAMLVVDARDAEPEIARAEPLEPDLGQDRLEPVGLVRLVDVVGEVAAAVADRADDLDLPVPLDVGRASARSCPPSGSAGSRPRPRTSGCAAARPAICSQRPWWKALFQ